MSGSDTPDEEVLKNDKLNRRNMLLAGSTLAAASALVPQLARPTKQALQAPTATVRSR
jgi:hypothetical protein